MKKVFIVLFLFGLILICSFITPIAYYRYYDRFVVLYTHIFSDKGKILPGQFVLYILIWALFLFLLYTGVDYLKKKRKA